MPQSGLNLRVKTPLFYVHFDTKAEVKFGLSNERKTDK